MVSRTQELVERLKRRTQDPDPAIDEWPARVFPPVSVRAITVAERKLGFPLPDLLRAIYTQVGNGGFGPSYGFIGLPGGAVDEFGDNLETNYQAMLKLAQENPHWRWPEGLLPVCGLGCGMWSCLDCLVPRVPVFIFDPNTIDPDETEQDEAVLRWTNAFWHESPSFARWLDDWLKGRPWSEPQWPGKAWLNKRLWPGRPKNVRLFLES